MTGPMLTVLRNTAAKSQGKPRLSVLAPFYRDDPRVLARALARTAPAGVELIAFDDGRPDAELSEAVGQAFSDLALPATLITSRVNHGRSGARNRLAEAARGDWLLFLDADMRTQDGFLERWLAAMDASEAGALFGGYAPCTPQRDTRVHAALAAASDVHDAAERTHIGAVAVCSSNLAVRRDVFARLPFDEGYSGWGWEDVDWALGAASKTTVGHIDNPASHGGLETVERLLGKFAQSGPNFARLLERRPEYAARPGARLAVTLRRFRLGSPAKLAGAAAARAPLPIPLRVLGLKLFRAGVAAQALGA